MIPKNILAVTVALGTMIGVVLPSSKASAEHYYQTADPQVLQAINEIITVVGQACNMGNPRACNAIPMMQQQAHFMLSAGYDCQVGGNMQACQFYQQNLYQLQAAYQQTSMALQSGRLMQNYGGGGSGMGMSHAERMQQIHNWGQQRLEYGRQVSSQMDSSHQQFLEMIRQ